MKTVQYFSTQALEHGKSVSPKEIVEFIENFRELHGQSLQSQAQPMSVKNRNKMKLISMKIPVDLLSVFKLEANLLGMPYQTLIKKLMQDWVQSKNKHVDRIRKGNQIFEVPIKSLEEIREMLAGKLDSENIRDKKDRII